MIKTNTLYYFGVLLCGSVVLTGCQNQGKQTSPMTSLVTPMAVPAPPQVQTQPGPAAPETHASTPVDECQQALSALRMISPRTYAVKKTAYDNLVLNARQYDNVRRSVDSGTQDTIDALYKYKTNTLCSDIEHDLMQGLIRQGESVR